MFFMKMLYANVLEETVRPRHTWGLPKQNLSRHTTCLDRTSPSLPSLQSGDCIERLRRFGPQVCHLLWGLCSACRCSKVSFELLFIITSLIQTAYYLVDADFLRQKAGYDLQYKILVFRGKSVGVRKRLYLVYMFVVLYTRGAFDRGQTKT